MEKAVNTSEETSHKAENKNDEFSIYASRIQQLMDRAIADTHKLCRQRALPCEDIQCKTVTFNGVRIFLKRTYPNTTYSERHAMGKEVLVSMYESGFEPDNIHEPIKCWDAHEKKSNQKIKTWASFDEYAISRCHKWKFRIADFKEWYREIWIANPDTVREEMKILETFLNSEPRKNPFKVALSSQYAYFDQLQFLECFEDFTSETMKDIIEFMHGEEQSLLTKDTIDEPPIERQLIRIGGIRFG